MIEIKIKQNMPLARFSTFRIGGPAEFYIEVKTKDDLTQALDWARKKKIPVSILGGGSNVLISDQGISGLVVKLSNQDINARGARLECGAGAALSQVLRTAAGTGLAGLEWAAGIPGTIGGAVRGNAGAHNSSMGELVETVEVFNLKRKRFQIFSNKDCQFGYRDSIFKENSALVVWQVILRMRQGNKGEINKAMSNYSEIRSKSQPKLPSPGCVFKNLSFNDFKKTNAILAEEARTAGAVKDGWVGAGWLIELTGAKGKAIGGAKISLEHGNFIVNTGRASAEDVIILISYIKQQVRDRFKVQLQEEIQYLGF